MKALSTTEIDIPVVHTTAEGFLKGHAPVTRPGVFKYPNPDGTFRYELRHPDEVFSEESLKTIKGVPITVDHPREFVNANNSSELLVGMTGDDLAIDGENVVTSINITDSRAVKAVNNGKKELSMGYLYDRVKESGVYNGEEYTHRQKNIRYNHLAIVDKGRAGRGVRIIAMDGVDYEINGLNNQNEEKIDMNEKELNGIMSKLASIEEGMQKAQDHEDSLKVQLANLKAENDKLKGESEALAAELSNAKAVAKDSADNAEANEEALVQQKVKERVDIIVKAKGVVALDSADDMTNREIMEAAIKATDADVELGDKTDAYIAGRFDSAVSLAAPQVEANDGEAFRKSMSKIASDKKPEKPRLTLADAQRALAQKYMRS